jgi:hypothetical protein
MSAVASMCALTDQQGEYELFRLTQFGAHNPRSCLSAFTFSCLTAISCGINVEIIRRTFFRIIWHMQEEEEQEGALNVQLFSKNRRLSELSCLNKRPFRKTSEQFYQ